MKNSRLIVRGIASVALATAAFATVRNANATAECNGPYGPEPPTNNGTTPQAENCSLEPFYMTTGPGASYLVQDMSTTVVAGTYALQATSLYNTAIYGVTWYDTAGPGVAGVGDQGTPGLTPTAAYGVWGSANNADGVHGDAYNSEHGVAGNNTYNGSCSVTTGQCAGVYGSSTSGYGVFGTTSANQWAVFGTASGGDGVYGEGDASGGYGVMGQAHGTNGTGVYGTGSSTGVYGYASGGEGVYGVYGNSSGSRTAGVYGTCSGTNCYAGYFNGTVDVYGELFVSSCSGCTSDVRLKKDVEPLTGAIDKLLKLKGVTFEWKDPSEHEHEAGHGLGTETGFLAQDVEKVFPNWVKQDGYTAPDGQKYKTLDTHHGIEALEVESIRTLKTENDLLKERVAALENGRQPRIAGFNMNGVGFGVGGLAIAGALVFASRRKRDEKPAQL